MQVHGDTNTIVADGHDAVHSLMCLENLRNGRTSRRFTSWLTPSNQLVVEGNHYRVRWVERFREVRGDGRVSVLRYRGKWEIDSEALDV